MQAKEVHLSTCHWEAGQSMQSAVLQKIALLADGFIGWAGGVDFLRLCIAGLDAVMPGATWRVLVPEATVPQRALAFSVAGKRWLWSLAGVPPVIDGDVSKDQLRDAILSLGCNFELLSYPRNSKGLKRATSRLGVEVILPCFNRPGPGFPVKWIGYYADLQHRRLPANFSRKECLRRDHELVSMLAEADAVIVPSRSVVRDIEEFFPKRRAALFALPFSPPVNPDFLTDLSDDILRPYQLPQRFFIISNQFWVHKSHQTAFDALRILRNTGIEDVHILCTGKVADFRAPGYGDRLKQGVARDGLSERVRFLGMIPKRHQLAIMRRSMALLQPTLFEGGPGGLSVFDAVSTATPAIISDIEVNREVDLGIIEFFRAGSAEDLAEKMVAVFENPPMRPSAEATLAMLGRRQRELGATLLSVISFVSGRRVGP